MIEKKDFESLINELECFEKGEIKDTKIIIKMIKDKIYNKTNVFDIADQTSSFDEIKQILGHFDMYTTHVQVIKEIIDLKVAVKNIEQVLQDLVEKNGSHIRIQ